MIILIAQNQDYINFIGFCIVSILLPHMESWKSFKGIKKETRPCNNYTYVHIESKTTMQFLMGLNNNCTCVHVKSC